MKNFLAPLLLSLPFASALAADNSLVCRWNIAACQGMGEHFGPSSGVAAGSTGATPDIKKGCSQNVEVSWKGFYNEGCSFAGHLAAGEGGLADAVNTALGVNGSIALQCKAGQFVVNASSGSCRAGAPAASAPASNKPLATAYFSPATVEAGELFTINWESASDDVKNVMLDCSGVDGAFRYVFEGGSGNYLRIPQSIRHVGSTTFCRVVPYGDLDQYQRNTIWLNSPQVAQPKPLGTVDSWPTISFKTTKPAGVIIEGSTDNMDGSYMVILSDGSIERRVRKNADGQVVDSGGRLLSPQDLKIVVNFLGKDYPVPANW